MDIFNANINVNKYSFNLRKIKWFEMKRILEWKEQFFFFQKKLSERYLSKE